MRILVNFLNAERTRVEIELRPSWLGYDASGWDLTGDAWSFLSVLKPTFWLACDGRAILFCHACPDNDMDGIYPDDLDELAAGRMLRKAKAQIVVAGHTHVPMCRRCPTGIIVNPGALLRAPVDDGAVPPRIGGTFGVLDVEALRWTVRRADDGCIVHDWSTDRRAT